MDKKPALPIETSQEAASSKGATPEPRAALSPPPNNNLAPSPKSTENDAQGPEKLKASSKAIPAKDEVPIDQPESRLVIKEEPVVKKQLPTLPSSMEGDVLVMDPTEFGIDLGDLSFAPDEDVDDPKEQE